MLKIRLQRVGRKNDPSFRVVCIDSRKGPKSGNNIEILGSYNSKQNYINIKEDRVKYWISTGAQISDVINNILVKKGIIKAQKKHVSRGKKNTRTPEKEEVKEENPSAGGEESSKEIEGEVKNEEKEINTKEESPAQIDKKEEASQVEASDVSTEEVVSENK